MVYGVSSPRLPHPASLPCASCLWLTPTDVAPRFLDPTLPPNVTERPELRSRDHERAGVGDAIADGAGFGVGLAWGVGLSPGVCFGE